MKGFDFGTRRAIALKPLNDPGRVFSAYQLQHHTIGVTDPSSIRSSSVEASQKARAYSLQGQVHSSRLENDDCCIIGEFGMELMTTVKKRLSIYTPDVPMLFSDYLQHIRQFEEVQSTLPSFIESHTLNDRLRNGQNAISDFFSPAKYYFSTDCSSDENTLVNFLLSAKENVREILVKNEEANVELQRHELRSLSDKAWLTDEVINLFMHLINVRSVNWQNNAALTQLKPKVYCFSTFFWSKLSEGGRYQYSNVSRWTKRKKVDIFEMDLIIIPVHVGENHWTLGCLDMNAHRVSVYDSLGGENGRFVDWVVRWVYDEHLDKKGSVYNDSGIPWGASKGVVRLGAVKGGLKTSDNRGTMLDGVPQQNNSYDCGVFTCLFAERLAAGSDFCFRQADMLNARKKISLTLYGGAIPE